MKTVFGVIGAVVGVIALAFCLELGGVAWFGFFEPIKENVRREVFENTKSYVHGKIQDLHPDGTNSWKQNLVIV